MNIELTTKNNLSIAVITGGEKRITDPAAALDLAMTARYETGSSRLAMDKHLFPEDFFILSTGLAGEILQKWINYQFKAAIWGNYPRYTSKPLQDFIRESNRGKTVFFVSEEGEAVKRLSNE